MMPDAFHIYPIGVIQKRGDAVRIEIEEKYSDAFLGLDDFSHVVVCYWFHRNDTPENRNVLQVHPRGDRNNPLTGVFATHSPKRPNLIAISICKILTIQGTTLTVDRIDAVDGSPVIDIKCYIPGTRLNEKVRIPGWVKTG